MKAEPILHIPNTRLGEGPCWDHKLQKLWWVDILNSKIYRFDPQNGQNEVFEPGQMVGTVIPCEKGGLILSMHHGLAFYNPETGEMEKILDPESDKPGNRFNDGKCDPAGRFWTGTMQNETPRPKTGALYCLDDNLNLNKKLDGIYISNGLAWTKDATKMYYIDTLTLKVQAFNYDLESGNIEKERDALKFDGIYPDGMCIDENDNLWIAFYGSGMICCFDPVSGKQLEKIEVPAVRTTSCTFGGENLDTLFITSARQKDDPLGGALFSVKPGVKGLKANFFKSV